MNIQPLAASTLVLLSCLLAGCATTTAYEDTGGEKPLKMTLNEMRFLNKSRLQKVSLGMTKQEVLELMGTRTFYQKSPYYVVMNPYRTESSKTTDGKTYEIILYYTDLKKRDDALTDDEMTPLMFENGKLVGWGWSFVK